MRLTALTRAVPESMASCELTHLTREPIDMALARTQHAAYEEALRELGCEVVRIAPLPAFPDSVFVEDTAIVLGEVAIVTRPGAESRRPEVDSMAEALATRRRVVRITAPGTIDGGDVLVLGRRMFVGMSSRSNSAALDQLRGIVEPHGYEVIGVEVRGVLHLKSAVTQVGPGQLLVNRDLLDTAVFAGWTLVDVDPGEPYAANALLAGDAVLFPSAWPRTKRRLVDAGLRVVTVDASEVAKAEGALTCCSVLLWD